MGGRPYYYSEIQSIYTTDSVEWTVKNINQKMNVDIIMTFVYIICTLKENSRMFSKMGYSEPTQVI